MAQVLRYFHQDPKKSVQSSSTQLIITQMSLSINNNTQALEDKQNTIPGKSLSSNDFTDYYKNKLKGIEEEAEVNVQADWDENDSTADSYIQNKPTSLPASDVYDWAKQPNKPSYNLDEVPDGNVRKLSNYIPLTQKGIYGGVATLGANDGKVPESLLPSYVDDVLEYTSNSQFPATGESGKIYVNTTTNLTYRWTGTLYTEISPSIALGETSSTAYAGDKGKALADSLSSLTDIVNDTQDYQDTLDWNTRVAIAKINGIEITAKLPSNPDTWRPISDSINTVSSTTSASLTAVKAAYDLAASKTSNTGTVTSVGLTVPTGLSISGSPITTSGTLAITYASGYSIPTTTKQSTWDAKQDAISDLATIRSRSNEGHTAYGWGDHAQAGYVKSSGVTSIAMTVPTGLSISGSPITSTGTLALSFASGYSIPTTAKLSNWDTAYGWGNHADAGYVKSSGVTSITIKGTSPVKVDNTIAITSTGTRTISLENTYGDTKNPYGAKTKNKVLAGPSTGADAVPTFRSLVADDIPTLSWDKINATVSTTSIGSASAGTAISADDITSWNAGAVPTLGTAISADDITSWSAGSTPTLGDAISADDITAWSAGSLPTLGTKISADDITDWSTGTLPELGTAISADDITSWATNTPTEVVAKSVVISGSTTDVPNISSKTVVTSVSVSKGVLTINTGASVTTGTAIKAYTSLTTGDSVTVTAGTAATLKYTAKSIPNVTSVGTLPSLSYTSKSIPNVTGVGTLPSLSYTSRSIPNVTSVGTAPSLSYTSRSIPNVTSVGTAPVLNYTAKSIPNISVTSKTVVTGITTS